MSAPRLPALLALALAAAAPAPIRDCADCPAMVLIEPGRFTMGTGAEALTALGLDPYFSRREQPPREVTIERAYLIGRAEVTRAEFARFAADSGYRVTPGCFVYEGVRWRFDAARSWQDPGFAQTDRDPTVCLSRADASAYAAWLGRRTGRVYRLPSEAEWEHAARAGTATLYPWGAAWDGGCAHANAGDRATARAFGWAGQSLGVKHIQPWTPAPCDDGHPATAPAASLTPNAWGLFDMIGNVQEWTADCWTPDHAASRGQAAVTDGDCAKGALRGQGWTGGPAVLRPAFRLQGDAAERRFSWGFRLAAEAARGAEASATPHP